METAGVVFRYLSIAVSAGAALYATVILLLATPSIESHVVYLHKIQMTWFKNLDSPEQFGFLRNQATSFFIKNPDGGSLHCWHIHPLGAHLKHEEALLNESTGLVADFTSRAAFSILRDDPDARLIVHLHGAGGTVGSGFWTPNYRALSAGDSNKVHVFTFDYRGFGRSPGNPSERGLISDALAVADWAMNVAGIPPSRILLFGQSLGTAVAIALSEYLALQSPPIIFAGTILVAPFSDVGSLMATYKIAGIIPLVSPLARFPPLFNYIKTLAYEKWSTKDRIESYTRTNEANGGKYQLTIIHAEDDFDIPWQHTQTVFWHAVEGTVPGGISLEELEEEKTKWRRDLGAAISVMERRTQNGLIREEIIKHSLHDVFRYSLKVALAKSSCSSALRAFTPASSSTFSTSVSSSVFATISSLLSLISSEIFSFFTFSRFVTSES